MQWWPGSLVRSPFPISANMFCFWRALLGHLIDLIHLMTYQVKIWIIHPDATELSSHVHNWCISYVPNSQPGTRRVAVTDHEHSDQEVQTFSAQILTKLSFRGGGHTQEVSQTGLLECCSTKKKVAFTRKGMKHDDPGRTKEYRAAKNYGLLRCLGRYTLYAAADLGR